MPTAPAIYAQDEGQIGNDLLPSKRRKPIFKAWMKTILQGPQWLHDLVFGDYYQGSSAPLWVSGTAYVYGNRVVFIDGAVYECINPAGITDTSPVNPANDHTNWSKVLDTWIGVSERIKYNAQLIIMEYFLNKYFRVGSVVFPFLGASHAAQIFITRSTFINKTLYMPQNSVNAFTWLPQSTNPLSNVGSFMPILTSAYSGISYTIHVPVAVSVAINATIPNEGAGNDYSTLIRSIVDKYNRAGKLYNIVTY